MTVVLVRKGLCPKRSSFFKDSSNLQLPLRFIRQLKPSLVPEHVDLSDSPPQQQSTPSSSAHLHGVRQGGIQKPYRGNDSSRGAPNKRGGGGSRDQWNNNRGQGNNRKGQGNRRH